MGNFNFERVLKCNAAEAHRLLVAPAVLERWSKRQDPVDYRISVCNGTVKVLWILSTVHIPAPFKGMVGEKIELESTFDWRSPSTADASLRIKCARKGELRGLVSLVSPTSTSHTTRLTVEGQINIDANFVIAKLVRNELVVPVLHELCDEVEGKHQIVKTA